MVEVRPLRVFTDDGGRHGNYLGVVLDAAALGTTDRLSFANLVGYSATVFVEDADKGVLQIFTPVGELPFAGHPVVGTAWLLARELGVPPTTLYPAAGPVPTWTEGPQVWASAALAWTPPWWHERIGSAVAVDALRGPQDAAQDATQIWAWEDEPAGCVRARVFASRLGIPEDEACGSACMRLAAALGRALIVRHGAGSIVAARPGAAPGMADVGGRVVAEPVRRL